MMRRVASLGKLRKVKTRRLTEAELGVDQRGSPRGSRFVSRLVSMGSSKGRRPRTASRVEVGELEMAFRVFDANGDGRICLAELGAVLRSLGGGVSVTDTELQLLMDEVDADRDGFISLEEFKAVHHDVDEDLREAFATFDRDGNNLICADELRAVLQSLGETGHTLEDCRRMISGVDLDGDGFVNYGEFQHLLSAKT